MASGRRRADTFLSHPRKFTPPKTAHQIASLGGTQSCYLRKAKPKPPTITLMET
jgi:hypothetical protein